ncbi:twin-arginine translocase TatA/TatE family subunit [Nibricoccus aquaticus]|uniref:Sec-independent protein translocase protein TatA n=1 Tax=Nibricoccus aquaticus TaxID=2576891 RepID=A0A290QK53_9BACT|nr:twin-arginine translocase TatA/TatE family subunit [Nibricoccus aquaticus]ATC64252.1 twin-arginine translocase TatA/TatE family subunit [Nibricoccus aquaticus]
MPPSAQLLAFLDIGGGEMMAIFLVVLLLFGGKKMPELARGLGKSIREFKKVTSGVEDQIKQAIDEVPEVVTKPVRQALAPISPVALPPPAATPPSLSHTPPPATPPPAIPPEPTP